VDIDTGAVSVLEREILAASGFKHTPIATKLTLKYLDSQAPTFNKVFRASVLQMGGAAQRIGSKLAAPLQSLDLASNFYPLQMLKTPIAPVPSETLRDVLPKCEPDQALLFEPVKPAKDGETKPSSTSRVAVVNACSAMFPWLPFTCCSKWACAWCCLRPFCAADSLLT